MWVDTSKYWMIMTRGFLMLTNGDPDMIQTGRFSMVERVGLGGWGSPFEENTLSTNNRCTYLEHWGLIKGTT